MTTESKLISVKVNGDDGYLVRLAGYQHEARALLEQAGSAFSLKGYAVSTEKLFHLFPFIEEAAQRDRDRVNRDRIPVSADIAATLNIGEMFDFGGEVGRAAIVGIGMVFTPKGENPHDERVAAMSGQETVFIYNANPPGTKPQITAGQPKQAEPLEKAPGAEAAPVEKAPEPAPVMAAPVPQSESDRDRMVIVVGSAVEGDTVVAWGQDRPISALGRGFILAQDKVESWQSRFPEAVGLVAGAEIQYAKLAEPRHELSPGL